MTDIAPEHSQPQPPHDDRPPDEPPLESEGIGPLGLLLGGVTEGIEGVITSGIGEGIIYGVEHATESDPEPSLPNIDIPTDEEVYVPEQQVAYEDPPPAG